MEKFPRFAVLADDLTGACDAGVQIVSVNFSAIVHFDQDLKYRPTEADAVVLDTETRLLKEQTAYQRVFEAGRELKQAEFVIKKIDSALRGPIVAEVAAALKATGRKIAVVAPAFPKQGRTTLHGQQLLYGIPVDQTEFVRDPLTPALQSHIPALFKAGGIGPGTSLAIQDVDQPHLKRILASKNCWLVVDAETNEHLDLLVASIPDLSEVLWVGSAGLVHSIVNFISNNGVKKGQVPYAKKQKVLTVIGSMSEVSQKQIAFSVLQPEILPVAIQSDEVVNDRDPVLVLKVLDLAREGFRTGKSPLIYLDSVRKEYQALPDSLLSSHSKLLSDLLSETTARLASEELFDVLILSGGYTAIQVVRRLGAWGIELLGELETGIPMGRLLGSHPFLVITKAGGFGQPNSLFNCIKTFI